MRFDFLSSFCFKTQIVPLLWPYLPLRGLHPGPRVRPSLGLEVVSLGRHRAALEEEDEEEEEEGRHIHTLMCRCARPLRRTDFLCLTPLTKKSGRRGGNCDRTGFAKYYNFFTDCFFCKSYTNLAYFLGCRIGESLYYMCIVKVFLSRNSASLPPSLFPSNLRRHFHFLGLIGGRRLPCLSCTTY